MIACDGTPNKSRFGANAMIATSMAVLHAAAAASDLPLWRYCSGETAVQIPLPEIQIFGGGAHAGWRVDIQECMVVCLGAATFAEALDWTSEVYRAAGELMQRRGLLQGIADQGGYWPCFRSNEETLDALMEAIARAGLRPGKDIAISIDVAASAFGKSGRYTLALDGSRLDTAGMIELLTGWLDAYPICSIEDPLGEDDTEGFVDFTARNGRRCQIIGDDFLVTNAQRIRKAAADCSVNSALIKPSQAGTITEAREALDAGLVAGFGMIVSGRSGDSEDLTVAHLAVGWNAGQLKVGSFARSERMAKWNELLRIEEQLGGTARLARLPFFGEHGIRSGLRRGV
ncbi:enolase [Bradyrhizobium sp. YR681]|nr:enolase [Bradyrhizobium sp. YR681]